MDARGRGYHVRLTYQQRVFKDNLQTAPVLPKWIEIQPLQRFTQTIRHRLWHENQQEQHADGVGRKRDDPEREVVVQIKSE